VHHERGRTETHRLVLWHGSDAVAAAAARGGVRRRAGEEEPGAAATPRRSRLRGRRGTRATRRRAARVAAGRSPAGRPAAARVSFVQPPTSPDSSATTKSSKLSTRRTWMSPARRWLLLDRERRERGEERRAQVAGARIAQRASTGRHAGDQDATARGSGARGSR
jgi:hypothetical protein